VKELVEFLCQELVDDPEAVVVQESFDERGPIYRVQVACGISAKVILVTLQKEQGLVTSRAPSEYALRAAMGMACPDTAPCDAAFAGLARDTNRYVGWLQYASALGHGAASYELVSHPGRATAVKYRPPRSRKWMAITYEQAMQMVAERMWATRERTFDENVMHTTGMAHLGGATLDDEENYLIKKLFTAGLGMVCLSNQARI